MFSSSAMYISVIQLYVYYVSGLQAVFIDCIAVMVVI